MRAGVRLSMDGRPAWYAFVPAGALIVAIFFLSHQQKPPTVGNDPELSAIAGHLIAYGLLALAFLFGFLATGMRFAHAARVAFACTIVFGVTDELHQRFVPGRHADPWDLVADAVGAAVAIGLVAVWRYRRSMGGCETSGDECSNDV